MQVLLDRKKTMKIKIKHAPPKVKGSKRLRLDSILYRRLKSYQPKPLKLHSEPTVPGVDWLKNKTFRTLSTTDYTSVKRMEKIITYLTSITTLDPSTTYYYSKLINVWTDSINPQYIFPSARQPLSSPLSYKWLTLYRSRHNLCLKKGLAFPLVELLKHKNYSRFSGQSYRVTYGQDMKCNESINIEDSLRRSLGHQHLLFATTFIYSAKRHKSLFRKLKYIKALLTTRKQQIRTTLLALASIQSNLGQSYISTEPLYNLLEVLRKSTYLTQPINESDRTLDTNTAKIQSYLTQISLYPGLGPNKSSNTALALLARKMLDMDLYFLPIDAHTPFTTHDFTKKSLEFPEKPKEFKRIKRRPILAEVVEYRAVSRTTAGGRTRRFRVLVVIGRRAGWVGVGVGKQKYIPEAIEHAKRKASKNIVRLRLTPVGSIPHTVQGNYKKARVLLKPLSVGSGLMTGPSLKDILALAGYRNVWGLQMGTSNRLCNIRACLNALSHLRSETEMDTEPYFTDDPYMSLFSALKTYLAW